MEKHLGARCGGDSCANDTFDIRQAVHQLGRLVYIFMFSSVMGLDLNGLLGADYATSWCGGGCDGGRDNGFGESGGGIGTGVFAR